MKSMQSLVSEASTPKPDKVPKGFKTLSEWRSELPGFSSLGESQARHKLGDAFQKLIKEGKVESKSFRVCVRSRVIPVMHYREI